MLSQLAMARLKDDIRDMIASQTTIKNDLTLVRDSIKEIKSLIRELREFKDLMRKKLK